MSKIPLLGLTTVTVFSAVILGAEQKKEYMVPIKSVAREIASYLDNLSLVNLSGVDRIMHWECRNELALRLSGEEAMMGQAHPIDFIRCNDECTLLKWMDHYADSDKRAALTLDGHCHLVRGMPITMDPIYNGEFTVRGRIQLCKVMLWDANLSKRGQWITYTNRDKEWIACKLNDDLKIEKEVNLKQPMFPSFQIVGSNYAISDSWDRNKGTMYNLYGFSDQSGLGDLIGTVTVPHSCSSEFRESNDGDLPIVVYVKREMEKDKDGKLICTVHTQSFIAGEHSSETVIDFTGSGITSEFSNFLTPNTKYVITKPECSQSRFTVSDALTGEIKIKGKIPVEKLIQDSEMEYIGRCKIVANDRYCMVCSNEAFEQEVSVSGFFDMETGEQMGPFFQAYDSWKWASLDLMFFADENLQFYLRSIHSPQVKIPLPKPDHYYTRTHEYYGFLQDENKLFFLDWKKKSQ